MCDGSYMLERRAGIPLYICISLLCFLATAARADDRIKVEIFVSSEITACGPEGYRPRPYRCQKLAVQNIDSDGYRFRRIRPAFVIPPSANAKLSGETVGNIREYQSLKGLPLQQRQSAVIVFTWIDRTPTNISLKRTLSTRDEPYDIQVNSSDRRTIYHLPLQYLNPDVGDEWTLTTSFSRYRFRFNQGNP